jgi:hypothetical protein
MNQHGFYTGWTEHVVTVLPSLQYGFTLKISGRNHRGIKDYISEVFYDALNQTLIIEVKDGVTRYRVGRWLVEESYGHPLAQTVMATAVLPVLQGDLVVQAAPKLEGMAQVRTELHRVKEAQYGPVEHRPVEDEG